MPINFTILRSSKNLNKFINKTIMIEIGKLNKLRVVKKLNFGIYLDGGEYGEILMPKRYVPKNCEIDDEITVFIYRDSEDRLIATNDTPKARVGEFALLEVVAVTTVGAFMDWGLPKDILVPYREQAHKMEKGRSYIVYIYLDNETKRIIASSKTYKFLDNIPPQYKKNEEVDILVTGKTNTAYQVIVNNQHRGVLYKNEVFKEIRQGQKLKAFIKKIREDDKIDLSLEKQGFENKDAISAKVLEYLKNNNGFVKLTDKSRPDEIHLMLQMSKRNFKQAIGNLYKQRLINIEENGIRLI